MNEGGAFAPSGTPLDMTVEIVDNHGNHCALGTIISNDTVLTHNHQTLPLHEYSIVDPAGNSQPLFGGWSDPVGRDVVIGAENTGKQTRLMTFSGQLAGSPAPMASQQTIAGLQLGDVVDIAYWDPTSNQVLIVQFTISDIANLHNGAISVDDPQGSVNQGESGGGVYYDGQLIGNVWSVNAGGHLGHIALIPPDVSNDDRAKTLVK